MITAVMTVTSCSFKGENPLDGKRIAFIGDSISYGTNWQGGYFLALKGPLAEQEVKDAKRAIKILGGQIEDIVEAEIPFTELKHKIIVIKKVGQTPLKYPRKPGIATKTPIGTCYNLVK